MIVRKDGTGRCPHCHREVHFEAAYFRYLRSNHEAIDLGVGEAIFRAYRCPGCKKITLDVESPQFNGTLYPFGTSRPPLPPQVPDDEVKRDYAAACKVAHLDANAAGALARRALARLLVKAYGAKESDDLPTQIEHAARKIERSALVEDLHYVREVGKFAAHAKENRRTGEIVDVTPAEVDATLTIVEELLEEVYVLPAQRKDRWANLKGKRASVRGPRSAPNEDVPPTEPEPDEK